MGTYNQAWHLGWAIGPVLGGYLPDSVGFRWTFIACAATIIVGAAFGARFVRDVPAETSLNLKALHKNR